MGKKAEKIKCLRCQKEFSAKPKKNGEGEWELPEYCTKCRNTIRQAIQKGSRPRKEMKEIRVVAKKINLKMEVETLRRLEHFNPAALRKMREEK